MEQKLEHLHVRTSSSDKAILAQAALIKHMSVSQFIIQTSVPIAERVIADDPGNIQTVFRLSTEDWDAFVEALDAPTRDIPELRRLLSTPAPWEKQVADI